jgi:hypothetical protein
MINIQPGEWVEEAQPQKKMPTAASATMKGSFRIGRFYLIYVRLAG